MGKRIENALAAIDEMIDRAAPFVEDEDDDEGWWAAYESGLSDARGAVAAARKERDTPGG